MAHESFEDDETAALMNEHFVNIKVDREERPDVDAIYMDAVVAMTGQGGWPMTVFLTPAGEPFFGGHVLPARAAPRAAELPRSCSRGRGGVARAPREDVARAGAQLVEAVRHSAELRAVRASR